MIERLRSGSEQIAVRLMCLGALIISARLTFQVGQSLWPGWPLTATHVVLVGSLLGLVILAHRFIVKWAVTEIVTTAGGSLSARLFPTHAVVRQVIAVGASLAVCLGVIGLQVWRQDPTGSQTWWTNIGRAVVLIGLGSLFLWQTYTPFRAGPDEGAVDVGDA